MVLVQKGLALCGRQWEVTPAGMEGSTERLSANPEEEHLVPGGPREPSRRQMSGISL